MTAKTAVFAMNARPRLYRAASQKRTSQKHVKRRSHARSSLSCKNEIAMLESYIDGSLDLSRLRAFEAHLEACSDCAAFLQTYRKTIELTSAFLQLPPPNRLTAQFAIKPVLTPAEHN